MTEESELDRMHTAWVRGVTDTKMGTAILTSERVLFFDEKFSSNAAAGALANVIVQRLQKRHEEGGPLLEAPLASITGIAREKKLLNKDRLALTTTYGVFLLNEGWKTWGPLLRDVLGRDHARRVVEEDPDHWRVEPA